jgi:hypothetical protein
VLVLVLVLEILSKTEDEDDDEYEEKLGKQNPDKICNLLVPNAVTVSPMWRP